MKTRTSTNANPAKRPSRSRWAGYVLANGLTLMLLAPILSHMIADPPKRPESLYVPIPIDKSHPGKPSHPDWPYLSLSDDDIYFRVPCDSRAPCDSEEPAIIFTDEKEPAPDDTSNPRPALRTTPLFNSPTPPPVSPLSEMVDSMKRHAQYALDRMRTKQPKLEKVNILICISHPSGSPSPQLRVVGSKAPAIRLCDLDASLRHVMLVDRQTASAWTRECLDFGVLIDASPDVGWTDVYRAIEVCRNAGLQRIEFTAPLSETPAPPGQPERR